MGHQVLFSAALLETIGQSWFLVIDLIGTMAFAFSGFILAYREKMTLFGALVLSSFPAVGGGIIRDLMVNRHPIAVLSSPIYILTILSVVFTGFMVVNTFAFFHKKHPERLVHLVTRSTGISSVLLEICDALGLAAFTVIGVVVALSKACEPFWLWGPLLAVLTSCGGGIIRDLFCSQHSHSLLKHCLYGEIAFFWGLLLVIFLKEQQNTLNLEIIVIGIVFIITSVFLTRLYAFFFNIPGMPIKLIKSHPFHSSEKRR